MKGKALSVLLILTLALFAVSAGFAAPILSRSFYTAHIHALDLPEKTGWSTEEIQNAYDDVMGFLLKNEDFGTGSLRWSESGKAHFTDVRVLFHLDLYVLCVTTALLAVFYLVSRRIRFHRFADRGASFWAGSSVMLLFLVVGALGALDFDRAFTVFHSIFFPGKSNWLFDPNDDQIIQILPEVFFRNCAILAIGIILLICIVYLIGGKKKPGSNAVA